MDSKDLRNLSEAWENIVNPEVEQLDEQGGTNRRGQGSTSGAAQSQTLQDIGQRFKSFADRGGIAGAINRRLQSAVANPGQQGVGADRRKARGSQYRQPAATTPVRPAAPAATTPVRPTTPTATTPVRPTTPTAPAATAPAAKTAPTAAPTATPAAPARRSLAQDLADLRAMRTASVMRQQGQKINGKIPTGADVQAAGQSVSDLNKGARQYLRQDADIFDIVKGYLMSEGYADTEQAAAVIMANMSEEWRQSIIEGGINFSVPSRVDDFNNRRDELKNRYKQDVGPRIPGPSGGGQYGQPSAPSATGVRLAKGNSSSKNNA